MRATAGPSVFTGPLPASAQQFEALVESLPVGLYRITPAGVLLTVNRALAQMLGYASPAALRSRGLTPLEGVAASERRAVIERLHRDGAVRDVESAVQRADGARAYLREHVRLVRDAQGEILCYEGLVEDITPQREAELALHQAQEWARLLLHNTSDIIALLDVEGFYRYASPAIASILGFSPDEIRGRHWTAMAHPDDVADRAARGGISFKAGEIETAGVYRVTHADGSFRALECRATDRLADPAVNGIVLVLRDVTERERLTAELARRAFHDPLTALPNRDLYCDRLEHALASAQRHAGGVGVVFIDLDDFKLVNDNLGHAAGDALLVEIGARLRKHLRAGDTAARFGGDEFTLLVEAVSGVAEACAIAARLLATLTEPYTIAGEVIAAHASAGVAVWQPGDAPTTPETLLQQADMALYEAKAAGKGRLQPFRAGMTTRSHGELFSRELATDDVRVLLSGADALA